MSVENMSAVLFLVAPHNRKSIWRDLGFPHHRHGVIESNTTEIEGSTNAHITYYVNCCPDQSETWRDLFRSLYKIDEVKAMDKLKEVNPLSTSNHDRMRLSHYRY